MIWKRVGRKLRGEVQVDLVPWQMHEAYLQELERGNPDDQLQWANSMNAPSLLPLSCRPKGQRAAQIPGNQPPNQPFFPLLLLLVVD